MSDMLTNQMEGKVDKFTGTESENWKVEGGVGNPTGSVAEDVAEVIIALQSENAKLKAALEVVREALEFYTKPVSYISEGGTKAKQALAAINGGGK